MKDLRTSGEVEEIMCGLYHVDLYLGLKLGDQVVVKADGELLTPERSQKVRNHSPAGFNWGYCGSGPAQLALAILLREGLDEEVAQGLYQRFKEQIVAGWNGELNWLLRGSDLRYWIEQALYIEREKQLQAEGGPFDEP